MAKKKTVFICNECGAKFPTWSGKCNACGSWGSITEEREEKILKGRSFNVGNTAKPISIVKTKEDNLVSRIKTNIFTLDEALGGGIVGDLAGFLSSIIFLQ
jgi:DNA repair protein RadA/Sms